MLVEWGFGVWWGWVGLSSKWRKMKIKKNSARNPHNTRKTGKYWEKIWKMRKKVFFSFFNWIFFCAKNFYGFSCWIFSFFLGSWSFFYIFREKWKFQQIVQIMYNVKFLSWKLFLLLFIIYFCCFPLLLNSFFVCFVSSFGYMKLQRWNT